MADPYDVNKRIYPEESKSETFSPRRPFGKKKKPREQYIQGELFKKVEKLSKSTQRVNEA